VETFDGHTLRRSLRLADDTTVLVALSLRRDGRGVRLEVMPGDDASVAAAIRIARRLLDLDADPETIDRSLAADRALRPRIDARPGIRLPGAADGFELAVRAILGQQITVRGARTMVGRIVELAGAPIAERTGFNGITNVFPTADRLADAALERIGLTRARARTLRRLAELVAEGGLDLSGDADPAATRATLLGIPGVGPWTVEYVAMRGLRDPDAFPANDLGVRKGFQALGLDSTPPAIRERAERWRPWRGYAAMHLWAAASG
jgi:AraC family transcriptional regulator of adaptative response / DNA-3-methyladenine glycosylase II